MRVSGQEKKQRIILSELEKLSKKLGLKVSSGKLVYAGLKLRSGQCSLRQEPWLILDRSQPFEEQVELFRQALANLTLDEEAIPPDLKEVLTGEPPALQLNN
ncbi:MAG: hypothetical protein LBS60_10500 [Deltaproteobacteria bacterium]|jgi:hypothetical protein|nr:hypothetical protein [Deltaproteobacteria bacterium]